MRLTIDMPRLNRSIAQTNDGFRAIRKTLTDTGQGQVLTSRRRRIATDKDRPVPGRAIANFLRAQGHDPFAYDARAVDDAQDDVARAVHRARDRAFRTGRSQRKVISGGLLAAAERLSADAVDGLTNARHGYKRPPWPGVGGQRLLNYWSGLARRGGVTLRYGNPPPYGVRSGRFVEGIRAAWKLGKGIGRI